MGHPARDDVVGHATVGQHGAQQREATPKLTGVDAKRFVHRGDGLPAVAGAAARGLEVGQGQGGLEALDARQILALEQEPDDEVLGDALHEGVHVGRDGVGAADPIEVGPLHVGGRSALSPEVFVPHPFPRLPPAQRGGRHTLHVHAPGLEGNPWADPATRDVTVLTPAGWRPDGPALPVVLVLPGYAGTDDGLLGNSLSDEGLPTRLDRLFAAGCPPFLTVVPDVMTALGGGQFVDSPVLGAHLSFLTDVVAPAVEAAFPTTGRWGVTGRSSGGLGAFNVAVRDPVRFRAAAMHAADAGFDACYLAELPVAVRGLAALGGPAQAVEAFWRLPRPSGDAFATLMVLCLSAAYADARLDTPFPARLPFDPETGAPDPDVLRAWRRHDPVVRAEEQAVQEALARLDLLFLDAGDRDEHNLHLGAARLARVLQRGGVPHTFETFPGGHRGTSFRYDVSLPAMAAALHGDRRPRVGPTGSHTG